MWVLNLLMIAMMATALIEWALLLAMIALGGYIMYHLARLIYKLGFKSKI